MIRALLLVLGLGLVSGPAAQAKDILGTATDAATFTVFLTSAKVAGLTDLLSDPGPITVFAPTDDAFTKLPRGTMEDLATPDNRDRLRALLMRHIVIGRVVSRDFLGKRMEAATASGALVLIDATKSITIGEARLVKADIEADNGFIHVIDTVLMPN